MVQVLSAIHLVVAAFECNGVKNMEQRAFLLGPREFDKCIGYIVTWMVMKHYNLQMP